MKLEEYRPLLWRTDVVTEVDGFQVIDRRRVIDLPPEKKEEVEVKETKKLLPAFIKCGKCGDNLYDCLCYWPPSENPKFTGLDLSEDDERYWGLV